MAFPTPDHAGGFTVIVTATIQPDKVDEFLSHFYVAFEKVASEPECLSFEVFRAQGEPNKIKWMENWSKSIEWFMQHQATKPYMKPYMEATDPLLIGEKQWEVMERFGGKWAKAQEGVYEKV
ncbi:Antibiotic biosynthesis monooxygenase [Botryosphaeria dothidea]|uniref:Antibiotic biosynthesis monooxygenase n=1 Tax=Botryosphaeria dothidea TaxID=55169 RepID=A0A8H4IQ29_9PEZI|nr:Antibiotic biosynthesis monooxygenase [Botryosphaeria dothidea]